MRDEAPGGDQPVPRGLRATPQWPSLPTGSDDLLRSGGAGTVVPHGPRARSPSTRCAASRWSAGVTTRGRSTRHLRRLDAEIQILATDREAALDQSAQLARELDDARARARTAAGSGAQPGQPAAERAGHERADAVDAADGRGRGRRDAPAGPSRRPTSCRRDADAHAAQVLAAAQEEAAALRAATQAEAERSAREIARPAPGSADRAGRDPGAARGRPGRPRRSSSRPTGRSAEQRRDGVLDRVGDAPQGDRGGLHHRHEPAAFGGAGRS